MNPGLPFHKEFQAEEVAALLDGSLFGRIEPHQMPEGTAIQIGQPADYPHDLTEALSRLFMRFRSIRRAYLALYADPARDPDPGLIICVDTDSDNDWDAILRDAGAVIPSVRVSHKSVDLIRFEPNKGGVSDYFQDQVKPFYARK